MNIAIIDDHHIVRKGIKEIIENLGDFKFIIEAENGLDFINRYEEVKNFLDICIVDIRMPKMDGFELIKHLKKNIINLKILVLTTYDEEYYLIKMIKLGVNGYLLKSCHPQELKDALISIYKDSPVVHLRNAHF